MLVVSDTSAITNLISVKQTELLFQLFGSIIIPQTVYDELSEYERQKEYLDKANWIIVKAITGTEKLKKFQLVLDAGEAEAIILALEMKASLLIIEEKKGRKVAEEAGLKIIGLIGTLVLSKRKGLITKLKPILDQLVTEANFRINKSLYNRILHEVGEF